MNKTTLILIIAVTSIVLFDAYTKYAEQKRKDDLRAQQLANQTILQLEQQKAKQLSGGGFMDKIGSLFGF